MLKKTLAAAVMIHATLSFAALDINKTTAAVLDNSKGISPAIESNQRQTVAAVVPFARKKSAGRA
jgi:hypothetical protein